MTPRVELTIDELVLDGFERAEDATEAIRQELERRVGAGAAAPPPRSALGAAAGEIARAAERGASG